MIQLLIFAIVLAGVITEGLIQFGKLINQKGDDDFYHEFVKRNKV